MELNERFHPDTLQDANNGLTRPASYLFKDENIAVEFPVKEFCGIVLSILLLLFGVMPALAIFVVPLNVRDDLEWWNTGVIYHIYPRSFQDSNADGVGDINGIISRLDHIVRLGAEAIWLGPVYKSPMNDFGYDVSDYTMIDELFGNMQHMQNFINAAHEKGLKVVLDFVPNHTSNQHKWFVKSCQKQEGYDDFYIWHPGKWINGSRIPPNNWKSAFGGSAWTWNNIRQEFYLHQFTKHQPDLNYRNTKVQAEIITIMKYWLDKGIDGFRIDAVDPLVETENLERNEPRSYKPAIAPDDHEFFNHIYTSQLQETYNIITSWRKFFDSYETMTGKHVVMMPEVWNQDNHEGWTKYYHAGADMPSNFALIRGVHHQCAGICMKKLIDGVINHVARNGWSNWALSNHDLGRVSSRKDQSYLDAMNMLLMMLPGSAILYYGDEIGMQHISVPYSQTQDPFGRNAGPETYMQVSRDPCRSPMQWNSNLNAGFTQAKLPWLDVHPNYTENNVQRMSQDPNSLLSSMKELITLREAEALKWGFLRHAIVTDEIYSFLRYTKGRKYAQYLVILNLGDVTSVIDYTQEPATVKPRIPSKGIVVFHTKNFSTSMSKDLLIDLTNVTLDGGQGLVIKL